MKIVNSESGLVGRGWACGVARVQSLAIPCLFGDNRRDAGTTLGLVGRAGRRTPCAGRAVMLTAVQSLRLLVRRGGVPTGRWIMLLMLTWGDCPRLV